MVWKEVRPSKEQLRKEVRPKGVRFGIQPCRARSWSEFESIGGKLIYQKPCSPKRSARMAHLLHNCAIEFDIMSAADGLCAIARESEEFLQGMP